MDDLHMTEGEFHLPAVLDLKAASDLMEMFLSHRGENLYIDGEAVQRLGGQCLQVLLCARQAWAADGNSLLVDNISAEGVAALELLGVEPASLSYRKDLF
jgi:chemotaxis protein CheX